MLKLYDYLDDVLATEMIAQLHKPKLEYYASDLIERLGYDKEQSFAEPITRTLHACTSLHISVRDNFKKVYSYDEVGRMSIDWQMSALGCYLLMINCDPSNPIVARAQLMFMMKYKK